MFFGIGGLSPCHHEIAPEYIQSISPESYEFSTSIIHPLDFIYPEDEQVLLSVISLIFLYNRCGLLLFGLFYFFTLDVQPRTPLSFCQVCCMCDYICL